MAHLAYHAVCEQDFDDVEADFDRRIIKQPQVVERGFGQPALLAGIYGSRGTSPILGRPRLHLDEYEAISVTKHEINLAARRAEIRREELQSGLPQVLLRRPFAEPAAPQVLRFFRFTEQFLDAVPEFHGEQMGRGEVGFRCFRFRETTPARPA